MTMIMMGLQITLEMIVQEAELGIGQVIHQQILTMTAAKTPARTMTMIMMESKMLTTFAYHPIAHLEIGGALTLQMISTKMDVVMQMRT